MEAGKRHPGRSLHGENQQGSAVNKLYRRGVQETRAVSRFQLQVTEEYGPGNEERAQWMDRPERAGGSFVQCGSMPVSPVQAAPLGSWAHRKGGN